MAQGSERKARSQPQNPDSSVASSSTSQTGAVGKISPEILDALAFAYLWALKEVGDRGAEFESIDSTEFPFSAEEFGVEAFENFKPPLRDFSLEGAPTVAKEAPPRDISGDIFKCIFAAFSNRHIPITTQTKPSDVMSIEVWVGVGRAILFCVAHKYPEFGPVAKPSRLPGFYAQSLSTLAQAIRVSIIKHS